MGVKRSSCVCKRRLKPRAQRCCRRKNPNKFQVTKPVTKKRRFGTMALFTPGSKSDSGSDVINLGSRVISFGKLPSYKYARDLCVAPNLAEYHSSDFVPAEVSNVLCKHKHLREFCCQSFCRKDKMKSLRKSTGGQSETGSEQSHASQRSSREVKPPPSLPPPQPERGIASSTMLHNRYPSTAFTLFFGAS